MDICYYNSQLKDELDGAFDYVKRAILIKKDHPIWADLYKKMSLAELDHAATIMKIFEEDYKAVLADEQNKGNTPVYLNDARKSIIDMYTEFSSKVNYLHDVYSKT